MIVDCPNCYARFVIDDKVISPKGRKLRCGECEHVWHFVPNADSPEGGQKTDGESKGDAAQGDDGLLDELNGVINTMKDEVANSSEPDESIYDDGVIDEEQVSTDGHFDDEDIPHSVRPDGFSVGDEMSHRHGVRLGGRLFGMWKTLNYETILSSAVSVAVILLLYYVVMSSQSLIVHSWPNALAFYDLIGRGPALKGEGLAIDGVRTSVDKLPDGRYKMTLSGNIINLTNQVRYIPTIVVTANGGGKQYETWIVDAPQAFLDPEEMTPFETSYTGLSLEADKVTFKFKPLAGKRGPETKTSADDLGASGHEMAPKIVHEEEHKIEQEHH